MKDGKPVRKYTTSSSTERHASLKVNRANLEDSGVFTCKAENPAGVVETQCRVIVNQKPSVNITQPHGASDNVTGRDGKFVGTSRGRLVLEAVSESVPGVENLVWMLNDKPIEESARVVIERNLGSTHVKEQINSLNVTKERLIINNLEQSDIGVYRVVAKNTVGQADASVTLLITDRPQPPASVQTEKTREPDTCLVQWQRPPSDGGSKIQQYIIESLAVATPESTTRLSVDWTTVGKVSASELEFKAKHLKNGVLYAFRVSAENAIGRSDPVEIETPIVLEEKSGELSRP